MPEQPAQQAPRRRAEPLPAPAPASIPIPARTLRRPALRLPFNLGLGMLVRPVLLSAAVAGVAFLWTDTSVRGSVGTALAQASRPLEQRAAFAWEDNFDAGLTDWVDPTALAADGSGLTRVRGLALHSKTMALKNYEVTFSAAIDKKPIGWVVRAADRDNYFVFRLTPRGNVKGNRKKLELVRYAVLEGRSPQRGQRETVPLTIPVPASGLLEIEVRVTDEHIVTMVNRFGADIWKRPQIKTGGVGFLAEKGESFLVKSISVSGNDDFLGRFLWGARETYRSLVKSLGSLSTQSRLV